ncbi:hypothetical protein EG68_07742 [Paragonimus skrjabini miyazakii]|uniref:Uncharacterized protein n=1 Tax=Paragonimus skrjabini miyazakii TaxID=59628 RepID=A0A8S9YED3_9TREM|nr:hypothetical protein EG68_07742 [Paragonimus skrjabini miyazakii]
MFLSMFNQTVSTTITVPPAELNTTAPKSNLSEAEEPTSANLWKNRWVQKVDVNDTSVQSPTRIAFRTDVNLERCNIAIFPQFMVYVSQTPRTDEDFHGNRISMKTNSLDEMRLCAGSNSGDYTCAKAVYIRHVDQHTMPDNA